MATESLLELDRPVGKTFAPGEARARRSVVLRHSYRLPKGATQGSPLWYVADLRLRVEFFRGAPSGQVLVGAATNGRATIQIEYDVSATRSAASRPSVVGSTFTLLGGFSEEAFRGAHTIRVANVLQNRGVRPGLNKLTVFVDRISRRKYIRSLTVLPGSRVVASRTAPPEVAVEDADVKSVDEAGDGRTAQLAYSAVNRGDRPAPDVRLLIAGDVDGVSPQHADIGDLAPGEVASGTVELRLPDRSPRELVLFSSFGSPEDSASVLVDRPNAGSASRTLPVVGLLAGCLLTAAALNGFRRRRARDV